MARVTFDLPVFQRSIMGALNDSTFALSHLEISAKFRKVGWRSSGVLPALRVLRALGLVVGNSVWQVAPGVRRLRGGSWRVESASVVGGRVKAGAVWRDIYNSRKGGE